METIEVLMTGPMMPRVVEQLGERFRLHRLWEKADPLAWVTEHGAGARAIASGGPRIRIGRPILERLPRLEIVASYGVGYDHVDAAAAAERGVVVTNTPDVLTEDVADLAVALLLMTLRQLPQAEAHLRAGLWLERPFPLTPTLRGRSVGIVGLGRIGKAIARRLAAFDVPIAYHNRSRQADVSYPYHPTLIGLAEAVDVLILVTPGGAETKHLVDAAVLRALGPQGVLINVARGSVVDEAALVAALRDGVIQSAGLDVFADETRVPAELVAMEHVVLLPHVGSASVHTRNAMGQLVVDNLTHWFAGKGPLTPVPETPWAAPPA